MTGSQTETTEPDETNEPDPHAGVEFTSWEFAQTPTADDVFDKLKTLTDWWGLRPEGYVDYIQPLSQSKNFSTDKTRKDYRTVWTLYVTVAGRIRMINDACVRNNWLVDFEPEPITPTGIPGMLQFDQDRIVYREYCVIKALRDDTRVEPVVMGRRPGTAWVPSTGGSGAVSSNRFEKVETSARGRAIAGWGFGVLPGSGVASLDEMLSLSEIRQAVQQHRTDVASGRAPQMTREDMESELNQRIEEFRQLSGATDEQMDNRVRQYTEKAFGKRIDHNADGSWNFDDLKDGEVILFRNSMVKNIQELKNQQGI